MMAMMSMTMMTNITMSMITMMIQSMVMPFLRKGFGCDLQSCLLQPHATTGVGVALGVRRTSMQSVFLPWTTSMIRFANTILKWSTLIVIQRCTAIQYFFKITKVVAASHIREIVTHYRFSSSFGGGSFSSPSLLSSAFSTEPSNASKHKSWRKSEFQTRLLNIFTYFLWLCSGNDSRKISYSLQICLCSIPVDQHAHEPIFQGGTMKKKN